MKIILFSLLLLPILCQAATEQKPIHLFNFKNLKPRARFLGSLKYSSGSLASKDETTFKSRTLKGFGGDAIGAVNFGPFLVGFGGDYVTWFQSDSKASAGNSDLTGSSTGLYGTVGVSIWRFLLMGKYYVQSKYSVKRKNTADERLKYEGPENSYVVSLLYRISHKSFLSLEYNTITYKKEDRDGTVSTLADGKKMVLNSVGVSLGFFF